MRALIISEFYRLYNKKSTVLCFVAIPIILIASAKYYLGVNENMELLNPQYTSFYNFPAAAIQEQLILAFNMLVTLLIVLSVTEELRNGSLRLVLIRRFKVSDVFISKFIVIAITIFLFLAMYFVLAYIVGGVLFPRIDTVKLFYHNNDFTGGEVFIYTIKYYFIAYLTLLAMASMIYLVATITPTVVIALGVSVGIILSLIVYPTILQMFIYGYEKLEFLQFLSVTQIQYQGIAIMLGAEERFYLLNILVIVSYIALFGWITYRICKRKDNFI